MLRETVGEGSHGGSVFFPFLQSRLFHNLPPETTLAIANPVCLIRSVYIADRSVAATIAFCTWRWEKLPVDMTRVPARALSLVTLLCGQVRLTQLLMLFLVRCTDAMVMPGLCPTEIKTVDDFDHDRVSEYTVTSFSLKNTYEIISVFSFNSRWFLRTTFCLKYVGELRLMRTSCLWLSLWGKPHRLLYMAVYRMTRTTRALDSSWV